MSNNRECADYFKSRSEYKRCFEELRKKWKSFGRAAGRITLANASVEERRGIGGIAGRSYDEGAIRFSVAEFEAGLQRTRFAPVELGEVLACYFGEELATNQEQKRREQEKRAEFFEEMVAFFERQADGACVSDAAGGAGLMEQGYVPERGLVGRVCESEPYDVAGFEAHVPGVGREAAGKRGKSNAAAEWLGFAVKTKKYGYQLMAKEYARDASDAQLLIKAVGRALNVLAAGGVPEGWRGDFAEEPGIGGKRDCFFGKGMSGGGQSYFELEQIFGREQSCLEAGQMSDGENSRLETGQIFRGEQKNRMSGRVSSGSQPLAVFAASISGNPHYFDRGTTAGQLLVHAICYRRKQELPKNAHEWRELLLGVGLMPDNVSSSVHAYGLRLRTADGYHPAYEAFCARREPCVVTLENLRDVVGAEAAGNVVYVVENEMVFSYLAEQLREKKVTLLCTSGQPRTAALELFSLLAASHAEICYSGDIDPEGIDIADRLWRRYGDSVRIWRMQPSDYEKSISAEAVDEIRLAKLDHVGHLLLKETVRCVREKRRAGYQENLLEELVEDVRGDDICAG